MTSAQFPVDEDAREVYDLLKALHVARTYERLYLMAQEVGLLELIRLHIPSVMAERMPQNHLITRVHGIQSTVGEHA